MLGRALLRAALVVGLVVGAAPGRLPGLAAESSVAPAGRRAMWVWQRGDPEPMVEWATAHRVRTIFAYFDPAEDPTRLRTLKQLCDAAGITLDALGGEPAWTVQSARALDWAGKAAASGLFHGLHVDVEPYLLPDWTGNRDADVQDFLTLLSALAGLPDVLAGLPLEADVPFWYQRVPVGRRTLADEVLARVDGLTVMSYRTTATGPNSIVDVAGDLLDRAGRAGKPVRLAAETQPLADCGYCSFNGTGGAQLNRTLAAVDEAARRYPAFAGIAVHQYGSWSVLAG